jgi:hypothetical protein
MTTGVASLVNGFDRKHQDRLSDYIQFGLPVFSIRRHRHGYWQVLIQLASNVPERLVSQYDRPHYR